MYPLFCVDLCQFNVKEAQVVWMLLQGPEEMFRPNYDKYLAQVQKAHK